MAFHERRFPTQISYGSVGGPGFNTAVNVLQSGADERIPRWATPKHAYDVVNGIKSWDDYAELRRFYLARHGVANGFRFFDWMDHTSKPNGIDAPAFDDVVLGTGDGTTTQFQLRKVYQDGSESRVRIITKPINGETIEGSGFGAADLTFNVLVGVNGSPAANWTVNTTTGVINFDTAPPSGQVVTAGFGFDTPVAFDVSLDAQLPITAESFDNADIDSIALSEYVDPTAVYEDVNMGGAFNHGEVSAEFSISMLQGRAHSWVDNSGTICLLPNEDQVPLGGIVFFLWNDGTTPTSVRYADTVSVVGTVPQNTLRILVLGLDVSLRRTWYMT
jgi:uncharacterized protein (TIGR02217 family)